MKHLLTNCPNCGAVLVDGYCNYCDTKVRFANEIDINSDSFRRGPMDIMFHIKQGDTIILYPFHCESMSIDHSFVSSSWELPTLDIHLSGYLTKPTEYDIKEAMEHGNANKTDEQRKH